MNEMPNFSSDNITSVANNSGMTNHDTSHSGGGWKSSLNNLNDLRNMKWSDLVHECRNSRRLVLLVVFIALFFDNMLLTTVVPIVPEYLFELDHPNATAEFQLAYERISRNITIHKSVVDEERRRIANDKWKEVQLNKLNTKVGLMFASKPVVQLIANPFIGPLTNK